MYVCMYVCMYECISMSIQTEIACEAGGIVFALARVLVEKPVFPRLGHLRRAPSPHSRHGFSAPLTKLYRAIDPAGYAG